MATFEDVLRNNGYQFSPILDQAGKEDILAFWGSMSDDHGGMLSDAELDSIIDTYKGLGVIEPLGTVDHPKVDPTYARDNIKGRQKASYGQNPGLNPNGQKKERTPMTSIGEFLMQGYQKPSTDNAKDKPAETEHSAVFQALDDDCTAEELIRKKAEEKFKDNSVQSSEDVYYDPATGGAATAKAGPVITYQIVTSNVHVASVDHPIMILEDPENKLLHHQVGDFTNPERRTSFECRNQIDGQEELIVSNILYIDKRFIKLLRWLGSGHIYVRLSGRPCPKGYAVYKIHAEDPNGNDTLESANDSFLQLMIRRLLAAEAPEELSDDEKDQLEADDHMLLTDMASMVDFLNIAGDTLPPDIRSWAHRNIALVKTDTISPEEKRHAQRALSLMLNIQWKGSYFESVDPVEARRILDEELYGMEKVKQRVIETIIQINRTHTLPAYGLLLVGPAGTGKSQIAYAVAKILKLPWAALDMSAIHDSEALTGSPRVYSNAKPGRIMEAFSQAGSSNIVFIINELDKAESTSSSGNPADALLTLLDNLGYTDNYIECVIPTGGVYPIATANDKSKISDPLLTRFAVIDIDDYTPDEKATIFTQFSLPKVLRRMGMTSDELTVTDEAVATIIDHYKAMPGVRDLEQAAEHLAANALYQIETTGVKNIVFDSDMTKHILEG